jgi:hypothetical protein
MSQGDGDFGITMTRGCTQLLKEIQCARSTQQSRHEGNNGDSQLVGIPLDNEANTVHAIGRILQRAMGGTSGALYGVFCVRFAACLRQRTETDVSSLAPWAEALAAGTAAISNIGGAKVCPFVFFPLLYNQFENMPTIRKEIVQC